MHNFASEAYCNINCIALNIQPTISPPILHNDNTIMYQCLNSAYSHTHSRHQHIAPLFNNTPILLHSSLLTRPHWIHFPSSQSFSDPTRRTKLPPHFPNIHQLLPRRPISLRQTPCPASPLTYLLKCFFPTDATRGCWRGTEEVIAL